MIRCLREQLSEFRVVWGSILLLLLLATQINIVFVTSPSIPYRLCLQVYNMKPRVGDICVFNYKGRKFLKYLVGTAGDSIKNINNNIYVGNSKVGYAETNNVITPINNGIISEGYVFVAGTHEKSFDSRYKEFGLIKVNDIRGRACGLMRWK
ncbi:MAG: S26 family signal peptidase [Alphaproteobacteria bacterium]|nr:S26 family signal peptidase [Alphaproteobacteria bacterium]